MLTGVGRCVRHAASKARQRWAPRESSVSETPCANEVRALRQRLGVRSAGRGGGALAPGRHRGHGVRRVRQRHGENTSTPATDLSDAIVALDMATGDIGQAPLADPAQRRHRPRWRALGHRGGGGSGGGTDRRPGNPASRLRAQARRLRARCRDRQRRVDAQGRPRLRTRSGGLVLARGSVARVLLLLRLLGGRERHGGPRLRDVGNEARADSGLGRLSSTCSDSSASRVSGGPCIRRPPATRASSAVRLAKALVVYPPCRDVVSIRKHLPERQ